MLPLINSRTGSQVLLKYSRDHFRENQSISSLIHTKISWIHLSCVGGKVCFHLSRMACLASKIIKAITHCVTAGMQGFERISNKAVRGSGSRSKLRACLRVSNITDQKSVSQGHDMSRTHVEVFGRRLFTPFTSHYHF